MKPDIILYFWFKVHHAFLYPLSIFSTQCRIITPFQETLDILKRPAPCDLEYLNHERRLRCRFMFPTIYQESNISSPSTTVFVSKSAGELPEQTPTPVKELTPGVDEAEEEEEEEEDYEDFESIVQVDPVDLLSLWGGQHNEFLFSFDCITKIM